MFKKFLVLSLVLAMVFISVPAMAVQLLIDSTVTGHFSELNVTRAGDSSISNRRATIDLSTLDQSSETGAVEVVELDQADVDQAFIKFTCTEGALNCNSSYTSTNSSKAGAVKVDINGTARWIQFFDDPN